MKPHYCPDWDYMFLTKDSPEMECCLCDRELKIKNQEEEKELAVERQKLRDEQREERTRNYLKKKGVE